MDQLDSKVAQAVLHYGLPAFEFLIPVGLLSAFLIFYISLKKESRLHHIFMTIGLTSFLAPILFFIMKVLLENLVGKSIVARLQLMEWGAFWVGGILLGVIYLRVVPQSSNVLMDRLTRTNKLERNKRTDVREIGEFLPDAAHAFDPLPYIKKKKFSEGVFLGLDEHREPVAINFPHGTSAPHIQVCGTTGAGKGVSLGLMASQFLERGEAVFFCDPKNDEWAPSVLFAAAQRTGKPYFFININRPNQAQFNPFAGCTEEEAFELMQAGFSLIEKGDASDFYGIADRREASVVAKLMASKNLNVAQAYAERIDVASDPECAPKFYGRLRELAETPSINATSGGVDLAELIAQGGCVYIVGSMRNDIVKTIQRIVLVRLIQLAERRDRMAGPLRPVCIVLDEVKYHVSRPALEALGAARDKGVHLILAHQSLGDLRDCTKDLNPDAVVDFLPRHVTGHG
jgi:type IV secretory pathway TraG/TraD family ATPase VirD4